MKSAMKNIIFIIIIFCFSILSCFNGWNDQYDEKDGELVMVYILGGSFQRDATGTNISVVSSFHMSAREVTRDQFTSVTGLADPSTLSSSSGTDNPVQMVNWYHTLVFCNRLSILEGRTPVYTIAGSTDPSVWGVVPTSDNGIWNAASADWNADGYRLPTEMEWMWAAMGGASDRSNGYSGTGVNTSGYTKDYAGSTESAGNHNYIGNYAWYDLNSGDNGGAVNIKTHTVGTKLPNELGLYDMSGNVWEWCWDWYSGNLDDYDLVINGTQTNYKGAPTGTKRLLRSGSFYSLFGASKVNKRFLFDPYIQNPSVGFRIVRR